MWVDNGNPGRSWGDLPTRLALGLIGLGVRVLWIPPRTPSDNGVVERSPGVAVNGAEPERCPSPEQLQQRLDEEDPVQRACYPHGGCESRLTAYPGLVPPPRPSSVAWEQAQWSWDAVRACLAEAQVPRRVDRSGKIGVDSTKLYVGTVNRGKEVVVQFDAGTSQ